MLYNKVFLKRFAIFLLTLLWLPVAICTAAQNTFTLKVGYWPQYGISEDESGGLRGYAYEYMQQIAKINHWNVEFIPCDWAEGLEMLKTGEIDVFGPLQKTAERELAYDYPALRMGEEYGVLSVHKDNDTIFYDDAASFNGKTFGSMTQNSFHDELARYCEQNHISIQLKEINDARALDEAFQKGDIDIRMSGNMLFGSDCKAVLRLSAQDFYYPTTKGNAFVLAGLDHALAEIKRDEPYYDAALYHKYYEKQPFAKQAFSAAERAYISAVPVIRIGYLRGHEPVEYYDQASGTAAGIAVDLLRDAARSSGLNFEFIRLENIGDAMQQLKTGELHLIMGVLQRSASAREDTLAVTDPILQNKLVFIVKQGSIVEEEDAVIALPRDWPGVQRQMKENYPKTTVKLYNTMEECLEAVLREDAEATVQNAFAVDALLKPYRYQQLAVKSMRKGDMALCLGASPQDSAMLLSIMNKAIGSVDSATVSQMIYQYTVGLPYAPSLAEQLQYNAPMLIGGVCLLFFILTLMSLHSRKRLHRLAYCDLLTGEMNLNKFKLEAGRCLGRAGKNYAVMVLDIDKFKSINDLYGYAFGDQMIVLAAKALRSCLMPGALLCHGTADKFYVFFEFSEPLWIAEQFNILAQCMENAIKRELENCTIVLSAGVYVIQPGDHNIISIIDRANIASKQVKSYHASSFAFYDQSMYDKINKVKTIENEMSAALAHEEFVVYLQPKIELTTRKMVGAEALVRWMHPVQGMIPPLDFIPLFEENGFIVELDYYMLEQVCKLLERWKREGRALLTISVNLSRRHLQDANTAQLLHDVVSRYDVDPHLIEIELTESAFDNCNVTAITLLFNELHAIGFTVSVDDFGAGYSSLSLLKDLPIDVLKIDKSFFDCRKTFASDKVALLLESVISLSRKMNIKTVSEGVETRQQVTLLGHLGCDLVQGFYFAKPMSIDQLELLLDSGKLFVDAAEAEESDCRKIESVFEETGASI